MQDVTYNKLTIRSPNKESKTAIDHLDQQNQHCPKTNVAFCWFCLLCSKGEGCLSWFEPGGSRSFVTCMCVHVYANLSIRFYPPKSSNDPDLPAFPKQALQAQDRNRTHHLRCAGPWRNGFGADPSVRCCASALRLARLEQWDAEICESASGPSPLKLSCTGGRIQEMRRILML